MVVSLFMLVLESLMMINGQQCPLGERFGSWAILTSSTWPHHPLSTFILFFLFFFFIIINYDIFLKNKIIVNK